MAKERMVTLRNKDESGGGVMLKRGDVAEFLRNNKDYVEEAPDVTESNQRKADAEVEAKAVMARETENKAVAGPSRNRG